MELEKLTIHRSDYQFGYVQLEELHMTTKWDFDCGGLRGVIPHPVFVRSWRLGCLGDRRKLPNQVDPASGETSQRKTGLYRCLGIADDVTSSYGTIPCTNLGHEVLKKPERRCGGTIPIPVDPKILSPSTRPITSRDLIVLRHPTWVIIPSDGAIITQNFKSRCAPDAMAVCGETPQRATFSAWRNTAA